MSQNVEEIKNDLVKEKIEPEKESIKNEMERRDEFKSLKSSAFKVTIISALATCALGALTATGIMEITVGAFTTLSALASSVISYKVGSAYKDEQKESEQKIKDKKFLIDKQKAKIASHEKQKAQTKEDDKKELSSPQTETKTKQEDIEQGQ